MTVSDMVSIDILCSIFLVDLTVTTAKTLIRLRRDDDEINKVMNFPSLPLMVLSACPPTAGGARQNIIPAALTPLSLFCSALSRLIQMNLACLYSVKTKKRRAWLDLESLSLEDREIPLEKLTKLEKIGSGGFKDVYIGNFKGQKIAISEFRGQLSASECRYHLVY